MERAPRELVPAGRPCPLSSPRWAQAPREPTPGLLQQAETTHGGRRRPEPGPVPSSACAGTPGCRPPHHRTLETPPRSWAPQRTFRASLGLIADLGTPTPKTWVFPAKWFFPKPETRDVGAGVSGGAASWRAGLGERRTAWGGRVGGRTAEAAGSMRVKGLSGVRRGPWAPLQAELTSGVQETGQVVSA